jgi:hypothetical protein
MIMKEAIRLAENILKCADSPCGCVTVLTESASTTIRYGECSRRCSSFTGCPRTEHHQEPHCNDCGDPLDEDPRNYQ